MVYSVEEIRLARTYIKKNAADVIFAEKGGGNLTRLSGNDVELLFGLYDAIFFQNQIRKKLEEDRIKIGFYAIETKPGSGSIIKANKSSNSYAIEVFPNAFGDIIETYRKETGHGSKFLTNRLDCLMMVLEHQIIHLLLFLWNFYPGIGRSGKMYGPHGKLFSCMMHSYFGGTFYVPDLSVVARVEDETPEPYPLEESSVKFGYSYWSNSCYLDSLMVCILQNASPVWRQGLMNSVIGDFVYPSGGSVCDVAGGSKIVSERQVAVHAAKIQNQIILDYENLGKEVSRCGILRELIAGCLPGMKRGGWVTYSSNLVYDMLAGMFPVLSMDIPIQIHRWIPNKRTWVADPVKYQKTSSCNMWEFMETLPGDTRGEDYKLFRWDLVDTPGLVFYNGGTPRIKNFSSTGVEKGVNIIMGTKHPFEVTKSRSFGETILDHKYRLVGVITLKGVSAFGEGGAHYVARFMGKDQRWYYYDDIKAVLTPIDKLPEQGVWKEYGGEMPSMYFYQRMPKYSAERLILGKSAPGYGELYKIYPKFTVYNYSERLVALTGPGARKVIERLGGYALEIDLKYGLGRGYILPKSKVSGMEKMDI